MMWMLVLGACGGSDEEPAIEPPDDCPAGEMEYYYDLSNADTDDAGVGSMSVENYVFVNRLGDDLGQLQLGNSVSLQFDELLSSANPTVPVRGFVRFGGERDYGHCETASFSGSLSELSTGDGWKFSLVGLHRAPYCDTPPLQGSFAACFKQAQR